jgi:hypothetical protein
MMWIRTISRMLVCLAMAGVFSPAHALTEQEIVAKLQAAGYSQMGEIKSTGRHRGDRDPQPYARRAAPHVLHPLLGQ